MHARHRRRAQDAARRRRRGRHGGDLRQPGVGGAARRSSCCCSSIARARSSRWRWPRRRRPAVRIAFVGTAPVFADAGRSAQPGGGALAVYIVLGALVGVASRRASRARSTRSRTLFEKLPIHWMWWPALGARRRRRGRLLRAAHAGRRLRQHRATSSRGTLAGRRAGRRSCVLKFVSWSISLGSGTSGGTLAPLFTIGGGARRAARRRRWRALLPRLGVDPRIGGAGRHGGDLRRRLARAAGVGGVRVRDDAPAARPAAAARRLHGGVPRLVRC